MIEAHRSFEVIRPDEVAECWEGIIAVPGLYAALWACVGDYKGNYILDSRNGIG